MLSFALISAQFNETMTNALRSHVNDRESLIYMENKPAAHQQKFLQKIKDLVAQKADPNTYIVSFYTPLLWASRLGDSDLADFLLQHGANINGAHPRCHPPLAIACYYGKRNIIDKLLKYGALVNLPGLQADSALTLATRGGHPDIVLELLKRDAIIETPDKTGKSILLTAAKKSNKALVITLLEFGAEISESTIKAAKGATKNLLQRLFDSDGLPLHKAARLNDIDGLKKELTQYEAGAKETEVNKQNAAGLTALAIVMVWRNEQATLLLMAHGANPLVGQLNCLRLAKKIKEWQPARATDKNNRSLAQQIEEVVRLPYLVEIGLCAQDIPPEVVSLIVDHMLVQLYQ